MRKFFKRAVSFFLIPATRWYLRKERNYIYEGIKIKIPPTVFHPGLFPSTKFLIEYLRRTELEGKSLLELGCGSGLISVWAARQNANVYACDLNPQAVSACSANAERNQIKLKTIQSNLFDALPKMKLDWIVINPPYYAREAKTQEELAWHCGPDFEYFQKLFSTLAEYIHDHSKVIMVLTQGCDIDSIRKVAASNRFEFVLKAEKSVLFDGRDFIFEISPTLGIGSKNS